MAGLILGALIFALGLVTFVHHNSVTLLILASGLVIALYSAARLAAALVMRGIEAELVKRDALPVRAPIAPASTAPEMASSINASSMNAAPTNVSSTNASPTEAERLN